MQAVKLQKSILYLYVFTMMICVYAQNFDSGTRICKSVDVRNYPSNLESLRGCRVVEGYVRVVLIDKANSTDYDQYSFPELREITQYLMFYRVTGLRNISQLFPNLALIRGDRVFEDCALIIYEAFHLELIGLKSLTDILRGAVVIAKNPCLCYVKTVDWNRIAKWDSLKNYLEHNKKQEDCPSRKACADANCQESLCWSKTDCQIQSQEVEGCHPLCVGGCSGPGPTDCYSCRKFLTLDGECVKTCPNGTYQHLNRRCITAEQCYAVVVQPSAQTYPSHLNSIEQEVEKVPNYITFNGTCIENCPPGYEFTQNKRGCQPCNKGKCRKICAGLNVENIAAAQTLRGCTYIKGSLEITIKNGKHKIIAEELEDSLSSIEEIEGYLKIVRSFPLVNLNFLKNLTVINGSLSLDSNKYALVVLDNQNLQELWDWDKKTQFKILKGRIFFHYNPKLCLSHIDKLISIIHHENITNSEVARESNGDKFACNATDINIYVNEKYSNAIQFAIPPPTYENGRPPALLRYVLYYVKAQDKNVTIFDAPDECGDNGWQTKDISVSDSEGHPGPYGNGTIIMLVTRLEPNTQYAFYVKTYTVESIGGQSTIQYVQTLPSQPSALMSLQGYSNSSSKIVVHWEPPKKPNGKLTEYVVSGFRHNEDKLVIDQRNYCTSPMVPVIESVTNSPNFMTHVQSEAETCCAENKITYTPKDGFERLCDQSGKFKIPFGYSDHDFSQSCERYFYTHIYTSPLEPKNTKLEDFGEDVSHKSNNKNVPKRDDKAELKSLLLESSRMVVKSETMNKDGTYNTFIRHLNASIDIISFDNLRHYSTYTIEVKVCRERHPEELPNSPSCSVTDFITIRTMKKFIADTITGEIKLETNNRTILVSWDEPKSPNGIIVAYKIEHRRTDVENPKPITECLTRLEYEVNGHSWSINGLSPGKYALRIRAISLAGEGPFTDLIEFNIEEKRNGSFKIFLGIFIIFIFILGLISGFYVFYWRKRITISNNRLFASVNPEYTSVVQYIEDEWELSRDNVELVKELGQGTFGMVYEGILRPSMTRCAVKTVNETATQNDTNLFLNEASVMKCTVDVHHIVRLLGVVSRGNPPLVVMELMTQGDLKSYLRMTRESYEHLPPSKGVVLYMSAQIADGMAYLETRKFVHRDLAARNCMVGDDLTVKIGDFGMTRDIYETDYYRKGNKGLLPIRWMAPECLKDGVFSSQSDVWSYGVVLWEIATLAEQPYQGSSNDQVLHDVIAGRILETPVFCPEILKPIMTSCWKRRPQQRPTFMQILSQLEPAIDDKFRQVSFFHSEAMAEVRKSLSDYVEMRSNVDDGHLLIRLQNSDGGKVQFSVNQDNNFSANEKSPIESKSKTNLNNLSELVS